MHTLWLARMVMLDSLSELCIIARLLYKEELVFVSSVLMRQ